MYKEQINTNGWHRIDIKVRVTADGLGRYATESLWVNYKVKKQPPQIDLTSFLP